MNKCKHCNLSYKAAELVWTENLEDLVCRGCHFIQEGIEKYKKYFRVEYYFPKH